MTVEAVDAETVLRLVTGRKAQALAALLREVPENQRRPLLAAVAGRLRDSDAEQWQPPNLEAVAVLVISLAPSAAQAATALSRAGAWWGSPRGVGGPAVLAIAAERGLDWVGDFALRVAAKLEPGAPDLARWEFVRDLLVATGTAPPVTEAFVTGWIVQILVPHEGPRYLEPIVDRLRADPYLDLMVPALFEHDTVGSRLNQPDWRRRSDTDARDPAMVIALAQLAAEGRVDRLALLDRCLARLLRGGRPGELRAYTRLHDELDPTAEEAATRTVDYGRLLADAGSPIATLAQKVLRRVADAGALDREALLAASDRVLRRTERGLVRTQLEWLEAVLRADPGGADAALPVVAIGFAHPDLAIQERALRLAGRHAPAASPATLAVLRKAAGPLGADLRARAADLFGDGAGPAIVAAVAPAAAPERLDPLSIPMPAPISSVDELAEEVVALLGERHDYSAAILGRSGLNALALDRVLDALVRLSYVERPALRAALAAVVRRHHDMLEPHDYEPGCPHGPLGAAIRAAMGASDQNPVWAKALRAARRTMLPAALPLGPAPKPHRFILIRIAEVAIRLNHRPVPRLVATPTARCGLIDPAVLLGRLSRAEAEGWQPPAYDLTQALLRLPRTVSPGVLAGARRLASPAGQRLRSWLDLGGLPDPVAERVWVPGPVKGGRFNYHDSELPAGRVHIALSPPDGDDDAMELLTLPAPARLAGDRTGPAEPLLWPAALPAHRELVAAHALPGIARAADMDLAGAATVLPLLTETTGALGPATAAALAYGLAAKHDVDRVATLDALLAFATAGDLDAGAVGDEVGRIGATGVIKLSRTANALGELAAAGGAGIVWGILARALPPLIAQSPAPRGLFELMALAAQAVVETGVPTPVPPLEGLAELAARKGSSRLLTEARRLHRVLPA